MPEICLAAVRQNGLALQFVKKQTPEICLAAVQQNGLALEFVKEQTSEICLASVKQNYGESLYFVKEQTPEICLASVQQCGYAICYVEDQTPEICAAAISKTPESFRFIRKQTLEIVCEYLSLLNKPYVSDYAFHKMITKIDKELLTTENEIMFKAINSRYKINKGY